MTIYLGADHNGFGMKEYLQDYLESHDYQVRDLGNVKFQANDDYPDWAKKVTKQVQKDQNSLGILICGSGQGMCMVANKYKNIRAGIGWSGAAARRMKHDDNANILCLPAWSLNNKQSIHIVKAWLSTDFSKLTRHKRRIKKINP
ncbi:MAG: RpiB/LacA/LacB family sugar-phosphate isomerase [Patescibacteria group bacterium]|jgi:ribose 5-phosphate isomerase B